MIVPDATHSVTFEANFSDLQVKGASWVDYWLQLDQTPIFQSRFANSCPQILQENREVGGAARAVLALWQWQLPAHLKTACGDDPNARFVRTRLQTQWQTMSETGDFSARFQAPRASFQAPQIETLSQSAQPYRIHLCATQNDKAQRARLEHGFCDESLMFQWQRDGEPHQLLWKDATFRYNNEIWRDLDWTARISAFDNVAGGPQVLAAALCRALVENRTVDDASNAALNWAQSALLSE